jgi:hypothetical protein
VRILSRRVCHSKDSTGRVRLPHVRVTERWRVVGGVGSGASVGGAGVGGPGVGEFIILHIGACAEMQTGPNSGVDLLNFRHLNFQIY